MAEVKTYQGVCDASAGVWLGKDRFAVAGDEENIIQVYSLSFPGNPLSAIDVGPILGAKEADLEGTARIGNLIFWIGSHGANKNGKNRPNRQVIFATDTSLRIVGKLYKNLLEQLSGKPFGDAKGLAPEQPHALNIEGLAARPDGLLWIGFRNPVTKAGAHIVALLNPQDVVKGLPARLGPPLTLQLGGLGIRSMEWNSKKGAFWIVAGSFDDSGIFALYQWDGNPSHNPQELPTPAWKGLRPEGLFFTEDFAVYISDDGGKSCDSKQPRFRILQMEN